MECKNKCMHTKAKLLKRPQAQQKEQLVLCITAETIFCTLTFTKVVNRLLFYESYPKMRHE